MPYITATIAEMHSEVVVKLSEVAQALDDLKVAVNALEVDTAALDATMQLILAKMGAGLPSSLSNGSLRVTDNLL